MQRPDNQLQIRIKECENPTFGYRRGEDGEVEKDVFDGKIPDGWVDSPVKVDEAPAPYKVDVLAWSDDEQTEHQQITINADPAPPSYEAQSFPDLRAEYKRRTGKGPKPSANREALMKMLTDLDAAE